MKPKKNNKTQKKKNNKTQKTQLFFFLNPWVFSNPDAAYFNVSLQVVIQA